MSEDKPAQLPPGTPPSGARLYAWIFLFVSILGLLTLGLERLALLPDSAAQACRAFYLCGPRPPKQLPAFEAVEGSHSTWDQVENKYVPSIRRQLEAENPDFDIVFHRKQDHGGCSGFWHNNCQYHYPGWWSAVPKWEVVSKWPLIILLCALLISSLFIFRHRGARASQGTRQEAL